MTVKIISLGFAVPDQVYTQKEVFDLIGYPHTWWRMFRDSGIDERHFCIPLSKAMGLSFQEQQDLYKEKAVELSSQAILNCIDYRDTKDVKCLVYGSCTGFATGPTIPHYLASRLHFAHNTYLTNNSGMGCEAAFPGLKRAYDYVKANGGQALSVNCELSSLAYWPEKENPTDVTTRPDPEGDYECLRANAVFSDAATAVLIGDNDFNWKHPEIVDTETYTNPEYQDELGFEWRNGRLRVILSRKVPELAPLVVKPAVMSVLQRQGLRLTDIQWWVIHAAGNIVIDNIGKALNLPEEKLELSRETLRLFGNTSSTSVGITGKRLMSKDIQLGDYVAMLSVGPGMSGGCTLLKFGNKPRVAAVMPFIQQEQKTINGHREFIQTGATI